MRWTWWRPTIQKLPRRWVSEGAVLAGSLLPDAGVISMFTSSPWVGYAAFPLNSFAGVWVLSGAVSFAFVKPYSKAKKVSLAVAAAATLHLLIDSLYWSFEGRLVPFFPFSMEKVGVNVLTHNEATALYVAVALVVLSTVYRYTKGVGFRVRP
ncbi:MAG: hypothetical protein MAG715_00255 [Methanonatronarchaeales archaeon]|nr:hypothetical protein [Methanonatronarchaeales archaeon]